MPFFPMRPTQGRDLRTRTAIKTMWKEVEGGVWIPQPKLNGDRVCLAVVERKIYLQNRRGGYYRMRVQNAKDYLRLSDGTCFDGEVFKGNFYPFELLALEGQLFLEATTVERVKLAHDMVNFLDQPWMFPEPNFSWLLRRRENLPHYEGVVLKRTNTPYRVLGSPDQVSLDWFKRRW
jgi:ATP-dependent DNA ligase